MAFSGASSDGQHDGDSHFESLSLSDEDSEFDDAFFESLETGAMAMDFFAEDLRQWGCKDWETVDQSSDPLPGAPIRLIPVILGAPVAEVPMRAYIGLCVKDRSTGNRLYNWLATSGDTGVVPQERIPVPSKIASFDSDGDLRGG